MHYGTVYSAPRASRDERELPEDPLRRRGERGVPASGGQGVPRQSAPGERVDQDARRGRRAAARRSGGRRGPGARARAPSARRTGGAAASSSGRGPRNYHQDVPKKVKALARRSAFNTRALNEQVLVIEGLELAAPKTRLVGVLAVEVRRVSARC